MILLKVALKCKVFQTPKTSKNRWINFFSKISDWVFNIPDVYEDCNLSPPECVSIGAKLAHSFAKNVDGFKVINVTCIPGKRYDGLPDWVW